MNVAAIIVTRGDVKIEPIIDALPPEWAWMVWDNSIQPDLTVYGRYAAIEETVADLIYVQDDDVIVSDPQAIVDAWEGSRAQAETDFRALWHESPENLREIVAGRHVVCNMPAEFRPHYPDSALVGFGACFERDLPLQAFKRFWDGGGTATDAWFRRTCDVVFTTLTPRILVDVPKTDRAFASDPRRMWKQPEHFAERQRMLQLARQVRDRVPA